MSQVTQGGLLVWSQGPVVLLQLLALGGWEDSIGGGTLRTLRRGGVIPGLQSAVGD